MGPSKPLNETYVDLEMYNPDHENISVGEAKALFRKLIDEIVHGDDEHRKWLRDKIEDFINRELK